jgi:hypothetical protein
MQHYDFLRSERIALIAFIPEDETQARVILEQHSDQKLSFHDALCAAVMLRVGRIELLLSTSISGLWVSTCYRGTSDRPQHPSSARQNDI